ncbi:MAG TPA: DUF3352 domain-containing protein [Candidatus Aminicenantes bacterium]|nr:DUF3352 domain-containing protein [Candidatus Aminicenantes bacterium]HRY65324.1 DUF3352 domain-containing protein [Candidatus Aminicenantes bacterium]HRZ72208.1 DUF3352 domain-containing protein [Candidatus Aminicenantes bacterium]
MKKSTAIGSAFLLAAFVAACAPATGLKTGAAAGEALIKMLPKSASGVAAFDVRRLMGTDTVAKALQDPQAKAKYDGFVQMSGVDPVKDIAYVGIGLSAPPAGAAQGSLEGGLIISLRYDKAKLQGLIRQKAPQVKEETYNGVTVYANLDGGKSRGRLGQAAFLDETHIALGSEAVLKGIIDVFQKRADSLAKNPGMADILKKADKSGIFWGAVAIPPELLRKGLAASPQAKILEGVKAVTLMYDDRVQGILADIRAIGGTKDQNANLAAALNGFKAMGAMFAAQEAAVGDFLNGLQITSGEDFTRLSLSVSHEVMDKLGQAAKTKAAEFMKARKKDEAPAPEVK